MFAGHTICLVATIVLSQTLRAQSCSGGPDGGMDATGNQCNAHTSVIALAAEPGTVPSGRTDDVGLTRAMRNAAARPSTSSLRLSQSTALPTRVSEANPATADAIATGTAAKTAGNPVADTLRELGMAEYEIGHYALAAQHFRRAAEMGDARSPEILALMYRYGERLYGNQVRADAAEAARWAAMASERHFPRLAGAGPGAR